MGKHYHVRHRSTGERYTVTVPADCAPASVRSTYEAEHWRTREISYGSGSRHDTDDFRFPSRPVLPDGLIPIDGSRCEPIETHPGMLYPPRNRHGPFAPLPPFPQEVHSPPQRHVSFAPDPRRDPPLPSYPPNPTRRNGQGHSRSRSAPVNPFEGSHHSGNVSDRLAQLPEYARRHPRFEEAKYAMQMIWRYPRDDPRAVPWQMVLRDITEDMERVGLDGLAGGMR